MTLTTLSGGCCSTSWPWLPIRLRTRKGMKIAKAKAKGRLRGKQPKLNPRQEAHLVELFETGEHSTAELADLFDVGRSTVIEP